MKNIKSEKTMRKAMAILLALVIILGLTGCESKKDSNTKEKSSTEAQKENGSGCTYDFPMTGFGFDLPEGMEIHRENGYIWVECKLPKGEVSEECQEEYEAFYNAEEEIIKNHMKFYPPKTREGTEEGSSIHFETTDLEGNPVNSDTIFAENKVTMINIWATTCGPCIEEMPELEKLNKEFAKKGGAIIGVVRDAPLGNNMYLQEAKDIVKDTGVTYPNIRTWDSFDSMFSVLGTPTSYFVDNQGNIIGDPVLGAYINKYKETMEKLLSQAK